MTASPGAASTPIAEQRSETLRLCFHQFRYDLRAFLRNRQSRFFTIALPVMFLVIFASVFRGHNNTVAVSGGRLDTSVSPVSAGAVTIALD